MANTYKNNMNHANGVYIAILTSSYAEFMNIVNSINDGHSNYIQIKDAGETVGCRFKGVIFGINYNTLSPRCLKNVLIRSKEFYS